ncbi:MAG TPA: large conductance mechanosensitive channel protein MscL [Acidimicrobiia bacterium]|nr:large conductance mechanosensitive channel protein MscL [Acidimicrobiia bacterium]
MLREFKAFILRGNVIDLAVGVAVGAAFTAVVTSFTSHLLTPLLAIPGDAASFADLDVVVSGARFRYGAFLDSLVSFVIVAAALFFFVVRPVNALMARRRTEPEVESTTRECPECLSSIPRAARRCAFCTAAVDAA